MCDICFDDGTMASCPYCGRLICFDEGGDDDVQAQAAVSSAGDVGCARCMAEEDRAMAEAEDDSLPPYGDYDL